MIWVFLGLLAIAGAIVFGSIFIAVAMEDKKKNNVCAPPAPRAFTKPENKMAEIIKREQPIDDFLKQNGSN